MSIYYVPGTRRQLPHVKQTTVLSSRSFLSGGRGRSRAGERGAQATAGSVGGTGREGGRRGPVPVRAPGIHSRRLEGTAACPSNILSSEDVAPSHTDGAQPLRLFPVPSLASMAPPDPGGLMITKRLQIFQTSPLGEGQTSGLQFRDLCRCPVPGTASPQPHTARP